MDVPVSCRKQCRQRNFALKEREPQGNGQRSIACAEKEKGAESVGE
jgi:hypothetical protein